jgi:hypothetical protein
MLEIIPALLAAALGGVFTLLRELGQQKVLSQHLEKTPFGRFYLKILGVRPPTPHEKLFADLEKTSAEMDRIVREIEAFTLDRKASMARIEQDLGKLSQREEELKQKIVTLEKVPLPAVEAFGKILREGEKKSAYRDYLLFLGGVVASVIVAIVLKKLGYG